MKENNIRLIHVLDRILYNVLYFLSFNLLLFTASGVFAYRTLVLGRLNWALLMLVIALFLINVCRVIARYNDDATVGFIYRTLALSSVTLLLTALVTQTVRFIYVFIPTMTEVTLPKILVRVGITTTVFYVYTLVVTFIYYLYANDMISAIWNGSIDRFLAQSILRDKGRNKWRQGVFASRAFIFILFVGGFASVLMLALGLIAWLLR